MSNFSSLSNFVSRQDPPTTNRWFGSRPSTTSDAAARAGVEFVESLVVMKDIPDDFQAWYRVNPECLLVKRSTLQSQVNYYVGMTSDGLRSTTSMSLGIDREELSDENCVLADSVVGPAELMAWIVEIRMWRFRWWSTAKEKTWTSGVMPDERGSGRRAAALYKAQVRGRHPVDDIHIPGPDAFLLIDQLVDFSQLPTDFQSWYDASPDYQKITRGQLQFRGEVYNFDSYYGIDEGVPMAEEIEIEPMTAANQALYHHNTPAAILFRQVRWFRTLAPRAKEMERRTLAYRRYRQGNERDGYESYAAVKARLESML
ncbi:unnamed protein product [Zymoseptoria tritici ST99CH_1E4]|uniref:Uncharacterized protein n=1 Tax=Zymoseptoria tritici ST99CH_1E4 TaxID=1276532 RepID=A0A2H1GPW6_ZYMTR|nr:unnamed protein product [Zymoseptoria tritici ST99CH_1E4]